MRDFVPFTIAQHGTTDEGSHTQLFLIPHVLLSYSYWWPTGSGCQKSILANRHHPFNSCEYDYSLLFVDHFLNCRGFTCGTRFLHSLQRRSIIMKTNTSSISHLWIIIIRNRRNGIHRINIIIHSRLHVTTLTRTGSQFWIPHGVKGSCGGSSAPSVLFCFPRLATVLLGRRVYWMAFVV